MKSENDAALILNGLSHWGPIRVARVRAAYGCDYRDLFKLSKRDLAAVKDVGARSIDSLFGWERIFDLGREKLLLEQTGTRFIDASSEDYPERLSNMPDAPIGLYWRGPKTAEFAEVAIVGSRRTTPYGRRIAREWAAALSKAGISVVSGLARGIDAEAHWGGLEGDGSTLAVLGSALDRIYPAEHLELFRKIEGAGAVISEMPFGRKASKTSFPMRNRIVSGMVRLVLVVETDEAGGSMITAKFAADQGKIVGAVPGRVDSRNSAGCHQLIRDGAVLMTSVEDVLQELSWREAPVVSQMGFDLDTVPDAAFENLQPIEQGIMRRMQGGEALAADQLVELLAVPYTEIASNLMMLELKRFIVRRADGRYEQA